MSEGLPPTGAVFVSYGSEDLQAAERIAEALRAAGIEVWIDKSKLRAGDAWDAQIRRQIHECALFIPVISAHTNARAEGYFRGEWNLATRRLANMAHDAAFLLPVVIDETRETDARVPEEFLRVQWSRLKGGEAQPAFIDRVRELLRGEGTAVRHSPPGIVRHAAKSNRIELALVLLVLILGGAGVFWYYRTTSSTTGDGSSTQFSPPPHSVAVLAFTNLSGNREDEYFSDGLSEEVLQALAQIAELKVAARTSSFSFKGSNADIPSIARKLNVGAVLEGSVRKAGGRLRVTAQLIDAVSGYHIWSENFDREFQDVITLQSEIARSVASALEIRLLADTQNARAPGGTLNPKALDFFLRGRAGERIQDEKNLRMALGALDEAIALDPAYANAHALRGDVLTQLTSAHVDNPAEKRQLEAEALQTAKRAVTLAPDSGFAYRKLGRVLSRVTLDYAATEAAYRRSLELDPGLAEALVGYASFAILMGRADALQSIERARILDPLNPSVLSNLGMVQFYSHKFDEARDSLSQSMKLWDNRVTLDWLAVNELASGHPAAALTYCEGQTPSWSSELCLAIAYQRLGRRKEAEKALQRLRNEQGDDAAMQLATIYAQWGQPAEAMTWLEKAARMHDPGLIELKADPLLDPLRKSDRFKELVAAMNFPT